MQGEVDGEIAGRMHKDICYRFKGEIRPPYRVEQGGGLPQVPVDHLHSVLVLLHI